MTPTEQDEELREKIADLFDDLCEPTNKFWHRDSGLYWASKVMQLITANYTPNSEVQDLVATSMADAADEASKAAINQLTMGGEWVPASEVAERERAARINEGQLFREAMIEHSTPAIYWGDRLDELREDKL